ncbi:MAG TPA: valine--tRNA ligase, partial [Thermodesulfovibrionales bacterium]|nr:valine--tRNA ligase [Thermodesulfovibrionales bacterium]
NPENAEKKWYEFWVSTGMFTADPDDAADAFTIVIPPPNVTGTLHMGHALNATLQDILIRWKRMSGYNVLWIPGMDHAGIATQNVVERQLAAEGVDRHTLGREGFVERVWAWKAEYGGRIINQLKRLGASCDWSRERFTLDEGLSNAVREVFVSLYEQGLIYRDNRLINWCPRCHTALSDIEVEHEDVEGKLTHIRYPFADGSGHLTVATTRPETMLGDTAVAVNPHDERYSHATGKTVSLPLTGRTIPVIADASVDPAFGTGAVKVTPSHDFNDEATAKRQSPALPFVTVIGPDGKMTADAGRKYAGMDRYECRKMVIRDLQDAGLIEAQEKHSHAISQCYRCKTVIEPLPALQWYVKVGPLAEQAVKAVRDGETNFVPRSWENTYFAWMENIKDWCISRQIWWGHRIPAWYCDCGEVTVARREPERCPKCGNIRLRQDDDVLDTWFSSALWPFSTLGWPEKTKELRKYYPTAVLVTGFDIIFFWVARMMMMGIKFMGDAPFSDVYIHALVRDASGQKMSKSKGNVIDPLVMMDKYGTDAFRFTLTVFAAQGRDVKFSEERVEGYRHFVNKLWNAARFILANTEGKGLPAVPALQSLDVGSRWIVSRLSATAEDVRKALEEYRFNDAAGSMYHFIWHELCDWYIEMVKPVLYGDTAEKAAVQECLIYILERALRLLHPFMPYVTEEIWQNMPHEGTTIVRAPFPEGIPRDSVAEDQMEVLMEAVTAIRTIRGELNLSPTLELRALVKTHSDHAFGILSENMLFLKKLARADIIKIGGDLEKPGGSSVAVRSHVEVFVPLEGLLDVDLEIERIRKEMTKLEETAHFLGSKLRNEEFLGRAPQQIVAKEREKFDDCMKKIERVRENLQKMLDLKGGGS